MKLVVATHNRGKVVELTAELEGLGLEVLDLQAADLGDAAPPAEDKLTFEENALLKARYYYSLSGLPTIADDSGLEVDILGGRPGVGSARYGVTDEERIQRLLGELQGVPLRERGAQFVCALAFVDDRNARVVIGICRGHIRHTRVGTAGFGYDPLFVPEGETRTFAQMAPEEKAAVSHRGIALRAVRKLLQT
jgi:XTP/dITP diphosphohydrolase